MKKATCSEQLEEAQIKLWKVLNSFQIDDIMKFVFEKLDDDIEYIDGLIENEIKYVKWESWPKAKAKARKQLKALRKNKRARLKAMRDLQKTYSNLRKIKDVT